MPWVRFVSLFTALLTSSFLLFAQATGRIGGVVTDPSGAAVPGATVACRNTGTGLNRAVESNGEGSFSCPNLPIGDYTIEIAKSGFDSKKAENIKLLTGQTVDLPNVLTIGASTQTVDVTDGVPLVQTAASSVQTTVNQRQMQDLPLNGRNPLQLTALTPGVAITDVGTESGQQDNRGITVNGLRATQNNFQLDGAGYTNRFFDSVPVMPNPDTLQEFTVQSSAYSAEYGGAGALVQLSTRSGTNQFHGTAFEFFRNTQLNARNFFQLTRPPFKLNQFGGTLGGAIIKNRTFFFVSGQDLIQRSAPSPISITTPTAAQRAGDFSALLPGVVLRDATGAVIPNNRIPQSQLNPIALRLAATYLPLPNSGTQYISVQNRNIDDVQYLIKIDQVISNSNHLSVRYFDDRNDFQRPFNAPNGFFAANAFRNKSLTIQDTHVFSPTLTGIFSASVGRYARTQVPQAPGLQSLQDLGQQVPLGTGVPIFPGIRVNINGFVNIFSGGALEQKPTTFNYKAALVKVLGAHTLSFGGEFERDRINVNDFSYTPGDNTFNGQRSGNALADFFLGQESTFFQDNGRSFYLRQNRPSLYLQDDWRVNNQFTLNLGLRWEPWLPPIDKNNTLTAFIPGLQSTVAPGAPRGLLYPGDYGIPGSLWRNDWNNAAPRVGFAWNVGGHSRTVVRGGYGIFYSQPQGLIYQRTNSMQPVTLTVNLPNPPNFTNPYAATAGGSPFPRPHVTPSQFGNYPFTLPVSGGVLDPSARTGYTQNWNFTVEQQVSKDISASVAYVGNHGVKIMGSRQLNPGLFVPGATLGNLNSRRLYPGFAAVEFASPYVYGIYHSLQTSVTKRTNLGLTLLANFVWSKSIDDTSSAIEGNTGPSNPFDFRSSRGPSDFDQTYRFNLSGNYVFPKWHVRGVRNVVLNDWQLNAIVSVYSGLPFTILSGTDRSLSGVNNDYGDRIGDATRSSGANQVAQYFNTAAFRPAALGTFGNAGRNTLRGPGYGNLDLSLFKNFLLAENWQVQFRAEAFNLQNRANFNNPNSSINAAATFGRVTTAFDPRVLQFALKLSF